MELQQLEYFRVMGQLEHVTRASEQLGITQPALSRSIARLERELGVPLFQPVGRSVRLSRYGVAFLRRVERALDAINDGRTELSDMTGGERGIIALGSQRSLATQYVPELVQRFTSRHPEIRFRCTEDNRKRLTGHLEEGSVDLCITVHVAHPRFTWRRVGQQELVLIVPPTHRLAERGSIKLIEVAQERFVSFKQGYAMRAHAEKLCHNAGFTPSIVSESDESSSIRGLVAAGAGVAIVPHTGTTNRVISLAIDEPEAHRDIGIAWVTDRYLSHAERTFRQFVIESEQFNSLRTATIDQKIK
jgi:DNA-binding transcriptional LysR family regulator